MGHSSGYTEAVAKAQANGNISQTACELGISVKSLRRWRKTYNPQKVIETGEETSAQLAMRVTKRQLLI